MDDGQVSTIKYGAIKMYVEKSTHTEDEASRPSSVLYMFQIQITKIQVLKKEHRR